MPIRSGGSSLLHDHRHGVGFIKQAKFARAFGIAGISRVHEDAAAHQNAVHFSHHRGNPTHVEVLAAGAVLAGQKFADVALYGLLPEALI